MYPTTAELKAAVQRIDYLLNSHVGHLGILVSAGVDRVDHRVMLESLDELEALAPGLYEMKIVNPTGAPDCHKAAVRGKVRGAQRGRHPLRLSARGVRGRAADLRVQ
ncbi:DUF3141 domain-containing protein [Aromatoleum toluclasticum]|uniref:DUF3141 domain-containing protein n=1 Tax=Aromatoleum toluclasticum TaxID=92003 RepID=UPI0038B79546